MSKYMTFANVVFRNKALLVAALTEIGCKQIEQGVNLEMGRRYSEQSQHRVEVLVPHNTVGNYYGDIGFELTENDSYQLVMDDLDQQYVFNGQFVPKLSTAYNEEVVKEVALRLRGTMQRTVEGGVVKIKVRY